NPLPGLTPGWSDLVLIAQAAGIEYRALIGEILSFAIRRYQERERERRRAARVAAVEGAGPAVPRAAAGEGATAPTPQCGEAARSAGEVAAVALPRAASGNGAAAERGDGPADGDGGEAAPPRAEPDAG
ncbi:MAG TPA: hypothetical protein VFF02_11485, partial [Anaeromyxobacteraceae bacterium]|nr:hypothetical protein [Anaeromyxobacteraceae bacterium]